MMKLLLTVLALLFVSGIAQNPPNFCAKNDTALRNTLQYGDIISFPRGNVIPYTHQAVYTGKEKEEHMVVHYSNKKNASVTEANLMDVAKNGTCWVNNNLDATNKPQSEDNMRNTINILLSDGCGEYMLFTNNCQHVASFIRYGKAISPEAEKFFSRKIVKPRLGKCKRCKRMIGSY